MGEWNGPGELDPLLSLSSVRSRDRRRGHIQLKRGAIGADSACLRQAGLHDGFDDRQRQPRCQTHELLTSKLGLFAGAGKEGQNGENGQKRVGMRGWVRHLRRCSKDRARSRRTRTSASRPFRCNGRPRAPMGHDGPRGPKHRICRARFTKNRPRARSAVGGPNSDRCLTIFLIGPCML